MVGGTPSSSVTMTDPEISWDLSSMVGGSAPEEVKKKMDAIGEELDAFIPKHLEELATLAPAELAKAITAFEDLLLRALDLINYGNLRFNACTSDKEAIQLSAWSRDLRGKYDATRTTLKIRFGKRVQEDPSLLDAPELANYRHYLIRLLKEAPYHLSEDAEKVVIEKDINGIRLFSSLRGSWVAKKTFDVEVKGEAKKLTASELSALRVNPDRETRRMATVTLYKSLADDNLLHGMALRSICADHMKMVKIRGMPSPMTQSFLDQDVDAETIDALLEAIEGTSSSFHEFIKLKAKVMGLPKLEGHDVIAPMTENPVWIFDWDQARKIVTEAFATFDSELGAVIDDMFASKRIDAANRVGKTTGAYCASHPSARASFVQMTFNNTINDVYTLAHELGHAAQGHITKRMQSPINWNTSSCLAEMGSIFGELLLTDKLLEMSETDEQKKEILGQVLYGYFYVVYYVGMRALFEKSLYETIDSGKIIDAETACILWDAAKKRIFGDTVDWTEWMEYEWARIPHHFMPNFRFYNYSYSLHRMWALLLSIPLRKRGQSSLNDLNP